MNVKLKELKVFFKKVEEYLIRNIEKFDRNSFIDISFVFAENYIGTKDFYTKAENVFLNMIYIVNFDKLHKILWSLLMMHDSSLIFTKAKKKLIDDMDGHNTTKITIREASKFNWIFASHKDNYKNGDFFESFEKLIIANSEDDKIGFKDISMILWSCVRKVSLRTEVVAVLTNNFLGLCMMAYNDQQQLELGDFEKVSIDFLQKQPDTFTKFSNLKTSDLSVQQRLNYSTWDLMTILWG